MEGKVRSKWFLSGLAVGCLLGTIVGLLVGIIILDQHSRTTPIVDGLHNTGVVDDPLNGIRPDIDESLHEFGRPATWIATHMALGDTGFKAAAGPSRYTDEDDQDWDYYSLDVEKPEGNSSYVYFQRDYKIVQIPKDVLDKTVKDIVTFDEASRVVTFTLGKRIETYTLPDR